MNEEEKETKLVEVKNEGKKKTKLRDIFILQIVIAIYTLSTVCAKFASGQEFLSFKFILFYGIEMLILGIYAIIWQQLIKKFDINAQRAFFLECGFTTKIINELCYPTSESASSFINGLVNYAKSLGVNFILETTFLDYQNINNNLKVMTTPKLNNEIFDKLIITTGGKSSPKMGSDGNVFNILLKHQYINRNFFPFN